MKRKRSRKRLQKPATVFGALKSAGSHVRDEARKLKTWLDDDQSGLRMTAAYSEGCWK